jgi:hypothetical protein
LQGEEKDDKKNLQSEKENAEIFFRKNAFKENGLSGKGLKNGEKISGN